MYHEKGFERSFGTFPLKGNELATALITALDVGYRAIDTAQLYQNEKDIGDVLASSRIKRDELFITSKVIIDNFSEEKFIASVKQSLQELQLDELDVLLLHWPPADGVIKPSVELLVDAKNIGLCKHIGVSNYTSRMLDELATITNEDIVCNQIEFHPLLDQSIMLEASTRTGVPLASYCPVARGKALTEPVIIDVAKKYHRSPAQVVLKWILQKGVSINVMSTKSGNIQDNFAVLDFTLSNVDMARIDKLGAAQHRIVNKELVPFAPDWD